MSRTGLHPSEHYVSTLVFNCLTGKVEDASTPFLFSDRKPSDSGFFPPLSLNFLLSFSFFLCHCLLKFPFGVRPLSLKSITTIITHSQFGVQPVEQCAHFQRLCLILARLAWLIFRVGCKTTLQPAYFDSCVCQDPPPVDTGHVGLERDRETNVRVKGAEGAFKEEKEGC